VTLPTRKNPRVGNARIRAPRTVGAERNDGYFQSAHPAARYPRGEVPERGRLRGRPRVRASGRTRWPSRSASCERGPPPDLLPSTVIIIIKSTLRAVRALVKECFISPRERVEPPSLSTTLGPQHHLRETTLVGSPGPSGPLSCRNRVSVSLLAAYHPSRTLKPAGGCLLPSDPRT